MGAPSILTLRDRSITLNMALAWAKSRSPALCGRCLFALPVRWETLINGVFPVVYIFSPQVFCPRSKGHHYPRCRIALGPRVDTLWSLLSGSGLQMVRIFKSAPTWPLHQWVFMTAEWPSHGPSPQVSSHVALTLMGFSLSFIFPAGSEEHFL